MLNTRFWVLAGITLTVAAARLIPHPPNATPVAAMALFGGAHFASKRAAIAVPLAAMALSDLVLGLVWYGTAIIGSMPYVYACFVATSCLGMWVGPRPSPRRIAAAALTSSVLFFLVTNFGVWLTGKLYPLTWDGLAACYVTAVPFFRNTLAGDAVGTVVLFGGFRLAERSIAALREEAASAPVAG
ncbi:MAG TPA: DUF6580 family putative transport protein [Isosphaeraceae bacterium]|nr:DUF6580 family putative transport protein [Isosphaeraceae bacterium]